MFRSIGWRRPALRIARKSRQTQELQHVVSKYVRNLSRAQFILQNKYVIPSRNPRASWHSWMRSGNRSEDKPFIINDLWLAFRESFRSVKTKLPQELLQITQKTPCYDKFRNKFYGSTCLSQCVKTRANSMVWPYTYVSSDTNWSKMTVIMTNRSESACDRGRQGPTTLRWRWIPAFRRKFVCRFLSHNKNKKI